MDEGSYEVVFDIRVGMDLSVKLVWLGHDTNTDQIELIFLLVEVSEAEEESNTSDKRDDTR